MPQPQARPAQRAALQAYLRWILAGLMLAVMISHESADAQPTRSARFLSAGALHERLASLERAAVEAGRHYVMGILDTLILTKDPQICIGPDVRLDLVVDLVKEELSKNPQMHRFNAASFVREVMYTHLKCT
ncbi:MAG: Rap1a/Tai family immunity protein [Betaproteobacteria bacterium]|jgi:hypothetical protein